MEKENSKKREENRQKEILFLNIENGQRDVHGIKPI